MTLHSHVTKGLRWQAIEVVGSRFVSFVVFAVLARLLQPADFGLVGVVAAYLAFVAILVDQGIGTALVQRRELENEHLNAAFWFSVACAIAICIATALLAEPLAAMAREPRIVPFIRWASLGIVLNATTTVQAATYLKAMDFRRLMLRTLIANASGGCIGITMAAAGFGAWSLIGQQLVASSAAMVYLWTVSPWRPSLSFSTSHLRQLMAVSLSVLSTTLLWTFSSRIDQLVIGRVAGAAVLGQYLVGVRLAELARSAIQDPVGAISMPALAAVQKDYQRLREAMYRGMELNAAVCFAVFGGLASIAPSVVPLVFGEQWRQAGSILQSVAFYSLTVALAVFYHPALLASGGPGRYVLVNATCAVGSAVACFIGIQFGVQVLVLLLIANMIFTSALAALFLRRRIQLSPWLFYRPCIIPALGASLMFAAMAATRSLLADVMSPLPQTVIEIVVGASVYLLVLWLFANDTLRRLWDVADGAFARSGPLKPEPELR